jgi:uncharacterized protein
MRTIERTLLSFAVPILALIPAGCAYLDVRQRQLIFSPPKSVWLNSFQSSISYEELWIPLNAEAGEGARRLHACWLPSDRADAATVLFLHGAARDLGDNAERIVHWRRMGFSVLAIDYRGYGKSPGDLPTEHSVYEDARAAWEYLKHLQPDPRKRFVYGHSLGGAVAIELASREQDMAGLIIESSFTSIREMVKRLMFRWVPAARVITQNFDSISKAAKLKMPVLFMHGSEDDVVPAGMSEQLHAQVPGSKQLAIFPGGHHSDLPEYAFESYRLAVHGFVKRARG